MRKGWEVEIPPVKKTTCNEEKEVVIQWDRASDFATIYSSDKPFSTQLKKNKNCEVVESDSFGTTFRISKGEIEIKAPKRVRRVRQQKKTE